LCSLWLSGCADSKSPLPATLTLKKDKTRFYGTVVHRDGNSITLVDENGDSHTFLLSELADIRYGTLAQTTDDSAIPPVDTAVLSATSATSGSVAEIKIPAGTTFPVRATEFIDSCCTPIGTIEVGVSDSNVTIAGGAVVIPQGANVTFVVRDAETEDGRATMQFELASADFGNRHYVISSANGGGEPGAVVSFFGPPDSTAGAGTQGKSLHLADNAAMTFRALTPVLMKPSR
jgi:hypothetical protein